ncbi:MAG: transketolase [Deltaproteobacteria bacterium]|nr:transketolase [Deltaproteobacteria bacterium]
MNPTISTLDTLRARAARLRAHSLRSTAEAGSGHPTSCLSAADIVAALFFDVMRYDPANPQHPAADRFVLSKGHAAPLLYAAWAEAGAFPPERLLTLRRYDSELEGHPTPRFSGTVGATGSLGQGLSIGAGLALNAKHLERLPYRVYVLLGDGETAEGAVWEAAAFAAYYRLDNLVAIVDVNALGQSQRTMYQWDLESYRARFAAFGWHAVTIDGHDLAAIVEALRAAATVTDKPVAIIARTVKGKGVSFLEDKDGWHGKPLKKGDELERAVAEVMQNGGAQPPAPRIASPPAAPAPAAASKPVALPSYKLGQEVATREAYGSALVKLGDVDPRIVVLDGDTKNSTFAERFLQSHPDRYFEAFIAEQNLIGVGVGLAIAGKIPFLSSFACFLTRGFDHIRMAAISQANLKLAGSHAGVSIGEDGPSQMGLEDIAMMRAVPGSVVLYPADAVSAERLAGIAAAVTGIVYLRLSRPKTPVLYANDEQFPIGGSKVLRASAHDQLSVVAAGVTLYEALKAHQQLAAAGIHIRVIDAYSVKPIDRQGLLHAARATNNTIITIEDHFYDAGLGDAVLSALATAGVRVHKLAVATVSRSGKPAELLAAHGIDAGAIVALARELAASK